MKDVEKLNKLKDEKLEAYIDSIRKECYKVDDCSRPKELKPKATRKRATKAKSAKSEETSVPAKTSKRKTSKHAPTKDKALQKKTKASKSSQTKDKTSLKKTKPKKITSPRRCTPKSLFKSEKTMTKRRLGVILIGLLPMTFVLYALHSIMYEPGKNDITTALILPFSIFGIIYLKKGLFDDDDDIDDLYDRYS